MAYPVHFLVTGLEFGGAELMLFRLVTGLDRDRFRPSIISLTSGPVAPMFVNAGVPVRSLGMTRGMLQPRAAALLSAVLQRERPRLLQTWMYHADLLGGLVGRMFRAIPIVWGIRHSDPTVRGYGPMTAATVRLCARLSRVLPARIICCSRAAEQSHVIFGYDAPRMHVIPNGIDLETFKPNRRAAMDLRVSLQLPSCAPVIGLISRLHPQKDHAGFLAAARLLAETHPDVHFVLAGDGVDWASLDLVRAIDRAGLRARMRLLGRVNDIARLMPTFDLVTMCSAYGEAFPNVVAEAMSCGVPCVVTDVGDAAEIVGDAGLVVRPRHPFELAAAWRRLLDLPADQRCNLGTAARARIEKHFALHRVVDLYQDVYSDVIGRAASGAR